MTRFIFLFSLNNSGTTVISRYLAQQTGGYLPPYGNNEGQMAPGVFLAMANGGAEPVRRFDWAFIRREWERLARRAGKDLFIEASPPNFMRAEAIFEEFGAETPALFSAASPYSFIASVLYNYSDPPLTPKAVRAAARRWQRRAGYMRQAMRAYPEIPRISYEAFCADPTVANRALGLPVVATAEIVGKSNEKTRGIVDQSRRQLAFLTAEEWDEANAVLATKPGLVAFFGYEIRPGAALIAEAQRDPVQYQAGTRRRAGWGPRWRRMGLRESLQRGAIRVQALALWLVRRPRRMTGADRPGNG
jgi:hypothetical protein